MKNIVLIGFMGTGKTTSGHILANRFGWNFIDVDQKIEEYCNMPISHIFKLYGEKYFRKQEMAVIEKLVGCSNSVIATGGGAILSDDNVRNLKKCGVVVCLNARPETIVQRLQHDADSRPLLNSPDRLTNISKLMQERHVRYQTADLFVDTDTIDPWEVSENIIQFYKVSEAELLEN